MEPFWEIVTEPDNVAIVGLLAMVVVFTLLAIHHGRETDRRLAAGAKPREACLGDKAHLPRKVDVWPHLVRMELLAALAATILLLVWSNGMMAPLEPRANPTITPNPSKAPWYFVGLQELLVYFDPWVAGVMIPLLATFGLMAIPYLDPNPGGNGYYTLRERPLALTIFGGGFFLLWLGPLVVGTFCRGPGWMWFWPWERWDPSRIEPRVNRDLTELLGFPSSPHALDLPSVLLGGLLVLGYVLLWVGLPYLWLRARGQLDFLRRWGRSRYLVTTLLLAAMVGVGIKILLRNLLDVQYVWVTPWFCL